MSLMKRQSVLGVFGINMRYLILTILILLTGCSNADVIKETELGAEQLPIVFELNDQTISLGYTDDNTGEDFIIITDKERYNQGLSGETIYFTILNDGYSKSVRCCCRKT